MNNTGNDHNLASSSPRHPVILSPCHLVTLSPCQVEIAQAVANLDAWLETMRGPGGYGGPVVHWWQNCLSFTGAGLDWRYEGIITGYLTLWQRTGQQQWLEKACRAGDDLVAGQLGNGNFRHSCFELNPYSGGTPHEAAAGLGLLRLAQALRPEGDGRWQRYAGTAERNLRCYYLERLWDPKAECFRDHPDVPSLVPNKLCTLAEALFAWADLRHDDEPVERYALPALRAVLALQVKAPGRLAGAIAQDQQRGRVTAKYFPYYVARCLPALLQAYDYTGDAMWLDSAVAAMTFVHRCLDEDGLLPQVLYERGCNPYPRWLAALGDVLRAADLLAGYGARFDWQRTEAALLAGQQPGGGFATGSGFAAQVGQRRPGGLPGFRDGLPVAGWNDKAFAYLAAQVPEGRPLPPPQLAEVEIACRVRGRRAIWRETQTAMALASGGRTLYEWRKGQPWATVVAPEVTWK